jgi:spore germination protein YaaH
MKHLLLCFSLLSILLLTACKPEATTPSPLATPPLSPIEPLPTDAPSPLPTWAPTLRPANLIVHVVQPGDTIMSLALQYNVSVDQINQLNGLNANSLLHIGQELIIGD